MIDVIVGISSLNEAKTIAGVTRAIDLGLQEFFPRLAALIVNTDSRSSDGTKEVFLAVPTRTPKVYLPQASRNRGKGGNIRNLLNYSADVNSAATIMVDGDLKSISPRWMRELISPVLIEECDFVYPIYERHPFDGTTTNLICYPVIYGLYLADIRQPIGGDFGLSRNFVEKLRGIEWPPSSLRFGIDLLITTEAVARRVKSHGAQLGKKVHRVRERAKKGPMTQDVLDTLIFQLTRHVGFLKSKSEIEPIRVKSLECLTEDLPSIPVDLETIIRIVINNGIQHFAVYGRLFNTRTCSAMSAALHKSQAPEINNNLWCEVLYTLLAAAVSRREETSTIVAGLIPLFFARMLSFVSSSAALTHRDIEERLSYEVQTFYRKRGLFLDSVNAIG